MQLVVVNFTDFFRRLRRVEVFQMEHLFRGLNLYFKKENLVTDHPLLSTIII